MICVIDRSKIAEWHVYALMDPRTDTAFYIGMTARPRKRLLGHFGSLRSAANSRCSEIRSNKLRPELKILATFPMYHQASYVEWFLLREYAGRLTNNPCNSNPEWTTKKFNELSLDGREFG